MYGQWEGYSLSLTWYVRSFTVMVVTARPGGRGLPSFIFVKGLLHTALMLCPCIDTFHLEWYFSHAVILLAFTQPCFIYRSTNVLTVISQHWISIQALTCKLALNSKYFHWSVSQLDVQNFNAIANALSSMNDFGINPLTPWLFISRNVGQRLILMCLEPIHCMVDHTNYPECALW